MGSAGYKCTLYADDASPPVQEIAKAKDVELSASANSIDITTRDSDGWKEFIQGLKEWECSVDQLWVPTDTGVQEVRDAFLNGTTLNVKMVDDAGYGFSGACFVTTLKKGQPLDGAVVMPVSLKGTGALTPVTP